MRILRTIFMATINILMSLAIILLIFGATTQSAYASTAYLRHGQIATIEPTDEVGVNLVTARDNAGHFWSWYDDGDWRIADAVTLLMHTNDTTIIFDDAVINAF